MKTMIPVFEATGERLRKRVFDMLSEQTEQEEIKPNSVSDAWTKITGNISGGEPFLAALRGSREQILRELVWREAFLVWYQKRLPAIFKLFPPLKKLLLRCWLDSAHKVFQLEPRKVDLSQVNERMMDL